MKLPILYKYNEHDKIICWEIKTDFDSVITKHYQKDSDKIQESSYVCYPTNVGKSNERDESDQAEFEAFSKWKYQKKYKGYVENINTISPNGLKTKGDGGYVPMKAQNYRDHADKILFPCQCQPKIDGIRCTVKNGKLYSGSGRKLYGFEEIEKLLPNDIDLDGELYLHGMALQDINSIVSKRKNIDYTEKNRLQYHVFDIIDTELIFDERTKLVQGHVIESEYIKILPTFYIRTKEEAEVLYKKLVCLGYEGMMYRNLDSMYEQKRSYGTQKRKDFLDKEFKIISVKKGNTEHTKEMIVSCGCITENDSFFDCPLCGTEEYRKDLFYDKSMWKNKYLTVKYLELSNDGIPLIPKGFSIRNDIGED